MPAGKEQPTMKPEYWTGYIIRAIAWFVQLFTVPYFKWKQIRHERNVNRILAHRNEKLNR